MLHRDIQPVVEGQIERPKKKKNERPRKTELSRETMDADTFSRYISCLSGPMNRICAKALKKGMSLVERNLGSAMFSKTM